MMKSSAPKSYALLTKAIFFLSLFSFSFLVSCKKQEVDGTPSTQMPLAKLTDSVSYTIDGKRYTSDVISTFGSGNMGANRDSTTGHWQSDTVVYYTEFGLTKRADSDKSDDGDINFVFTRKYAKSQLASSPSPSNGAFVPKNRIEHYKPGKYQYALDYERYNRQNGVAVTVRKTTDNVIEKLISYVQAHYQSPTTISANSQDNSTFEVTRFEAVGDGSYLLEANFAANLFDMNEKQKRIENGYLRLRIY